MFEALSKRDRAGRSASRRYARVAGAWRRRRFGRWTPLLVGAALFVVLLTVPAFHLSSRWALFAGTIFGMTVMAVQLLPDTLMPGFIFNWQLGAWGEQMTASELKKLPTDEWLVRHDLGWGTKGANYDHVLVGRSVYVLDTKYVKDSRVDLEDGNLRLHRLDDEDDGYLADRWVPSVARQANSLRWELGKALGGYQPHVYPVLVLWGDLDLEPRWVSDVPVSGGRSFDVFVLNGQSLIEWLTPQPTDLNPEQRRKICEYVRSMPRA